MPTYANSTSAVITIGDVRIEPGQSVKTLQFIPGSLPAGITEVTTAPMCNPIILSSKVTGNTTVTIPETYTNPLTGIVESLNGNYLITVYVGTGEATVQFNGSGTLKYVGLYERYEYRCMSRTVDSIVLTVTGTTYVTVQAI